MVAEGEAVVAITGSPQRDRPAGQKHLGGHHIHAHAQEEVIGQGKGQTAAEQADPTNVGYRGTGINNQSVIAAESEAQLAALHVPRHVGTHCGGVIRGTVPQEETGAGQRRIGNGERIITTTVLADRDQAIGDHRAARRL